jgi:Trypsin
VDRTGSALIAKGGFRRGGLLALLLVIGLALMPASSAKAIVGGELADGQYGAVGTVVFQPSDGTPRFNLCSGFLISPAAFVTAGHCAVEALGLQQELGGTIGVSLDPEFDPATSDFVAASSVVVHPEFLANQLSYKTPDMAVMVLAEPIDGVDPIDLPDQGAADELANGSRLTTVGYGFTRDCQKNLGHCEIAYEPERRFATETLVSVSQWFVTINQNPNAKATGGICLGDSGGPHLLTGTNTAVAITTAFETKGCWSISRDIRLDTETALNFLQPYLGS